MLISTDFSLFYTPVVPYYVPYNKNPKKRKVLDDFNKKRNIHMNLYFLLSLTFIYLYFLL